MGKAGIGGEASEESTHRIRRGIDDGMYERGRQEQHGKPRHEAVRAANRRCVSSRAGRGGVAEGCVVPRKPGNAGGGKAPWFKSDAAKRRGAGDWETW